MSEAEGTPIDLLEQGDLKYEADEERMNAIMKDINYVEEQPQQMRAPPTVAPPSIPQQPIQYMPEVPMNQPVYRPVYQAAPDAVQYEEDQPVSKRRASVRKNTWSTVFDFVRDPIVVALLIFVVSLPVLHTHLGKYATWMYKVGGQLSWLGLFVLSLFGGIMFASYQSIMNIL